MNGSRGMYMEPKPRRTRRFDSPLTDNEREVQRAALRRQGNTRPVMTVTPTECIAIVPMAERVRGIVDQWDAGRGCGFIVNIHDRRGVFVHARDLQFSQDQMRVALTVDYILGTDERAKPTYDGRPPAPIARMVEIVASVTVEIEGTVAIISESVGYVNTRTDVSSPATSRVGSFFNPLRHPEVAHGDVVRATVWECDRGWRVVGPMTRLWSAAEATREQGTGGTT